MINTLIDQVVNTELVIDVKAEEVVIALLKDKRLVELTTEKTSVKFAVGDIYYGKVKKIMPLSLMSAMKRMPSCITLISVPSFILWIAI